jgi:UDP-glucose 4-epimerase
MPVSLVTGGAGFMGSHIADELIEKGHQVIVLDDLSGGFSDNVPKGATFVQGSILDFELLDRIFKKYSFAYVYHLAAYAAEGLSHFIKRFNYHNNLIGSVNIINACVNYQVKCLVFTSSIAVYGAGDPPLREDMIPVPEDSYGIAKLAVEQELKVSHEMFGLDYVIFRPHNVYGERQNIGDRYRNVVGIFMNQILRGERLTVFGDGTQVRAFTHINDIAPAIAGSADVPAARNQIFNIGTDLPYSINDMATIVAEAMGAKAELLHLDPRNEVRIAFSDHSKAERVFGRQRHTPFPEGVRAMAVWVKAHGARESNVFEDIEVRKNLPASWARASQKSISVRE